MSKAAAKLEKVRVERDRLFSIGRYYEALQLYKTLYSRACVKKSWAEAEEIIVEGATALLQQGQVTTHTERREGGRKASLLQIHPLLPCVPSSKLFSFFLSLLSCFVYVVEFRR